MTKRAKKHIFYSVPKPPNKAIQDWVASTPLDHLIYYKLSQFLDKLGAQPTSKLYATVLKQLEKPLLYLVLSKSNLNQLFASQILGINRNTLRSKIKSLKLLT